VPMLAAQANHAKTASADLAADDRRCDNPSRSCNERACAESGSAGPRLVDDHGGRNQVPDPLPVLAQEDHEG
jgi:hypothetical protein